MVANDLCIKAKNRCGSVIQSSFQWSGVFRATRYFYTSNRGFAVTIFIHYDKDDTTVKLLSLKRQKIGMVHINFFSTKTYGHICCGCSKTVSRDFSFEHPKYKGSVACRSAFFSKLCSQGR